MAVLDLSLRHLQALVAVREHGSYRRAAQQLGYSQAAITQQIAALERALGVAVFDRHPGPRPVTLTLAGAEVADAAGEMLARAGLLEAACDQMRDGTRGRLAIGTFQSVSARLLPTALAQVRASEPGVAIDVRESDDNDELTEHLLAGRVDVTFLVGPVRDDRLLVREVCRDPFIAMVRADSAYGESVTLAELAGAPLIGHQQCRCHEIVAEGFRERGLDAHFVFRSNDNGAVQAMTRVGLGVAVMPRLAVEADDPTIRLVRLRPALPDRQILIAVPARRPSLVALRFVERVCAGVPSLA